MNEIKIIENKSSTGVVLNYIARDLKKGLEGRGATEEEARKSLREDPYLSSIGYKSMKRFICLAAEWMYDTGRESLETPHGTIILL
jgi:hypothetical protein